MTPERYRILRALFTEASDLAPDAQRAFLAGRCADAELRADVERLLAADRGEDDGLGARSAVRVADADDSIGVPERIGGYRVLHRLGVGGMGSVFAAEQDHPRRTVALKVLHAGLVTPSMLRRFEYEGEVLARLAHPGIAHIYDAGTTEIGGATLPWFAMELVPGAPITRWADERGLSLRERLDLVARVADAVEHAHKTGVIHRDLKPQNVLVGGDGQPKVLDFGIARAAQDGERADSLRTRSGMIVGTLAYMSPEQAGGDPRALDTRTDVYALGVLAYELVVGRLPHELAGVTLARAARIIAEEDPPRPAALDRRLRGDVETILLKALEKDKERRYASAAAFAADVRAHLRDEPIAARPATTIYQAVKFTRRHKGLVVGLAATFVALVVGLVVSLAYYARSEAARVSAEQSGAAEVRARRRADSINTFVLKEMFAAPDPWTPAGKDVTVAATLDRIASRVATSFAGDPELEADAHATLARSYLARGLAERGAEHAARALTLRRALHAGDHADVAESLLASSLAHGDRGELAPAERDAADALAMCERLPATPRETLAEARRQLASVRLSRGAIAEALRGFEEVLALQRAIHGDAHPTVAQALSDVMSARIAAGDLAAAEDTARQALALRRALHGDDDPYVALALNDLASTVFEKRDDALDPEIAELYAEAARITATKLGPEHRLTLRTQRSLANALVRLGRGEEAEQILRAVVDALPRAVGPDHEDYPQTLNSYGYLLFRLGRTDEAEAQYLRAIEVAERAFGADHDNTLRPLSNLAALEKARGLARRGDAGGEVAPGSDLARAEEHYRRAWAGFARLYGELHANTATVTFALGDLLDQLGRDREAADLLDLSARAMLANRPDGYEQDVTRVRLRQGLALLRLAALEEAEPVLRDCVERCRAVFPAGDWRTAICAGALGECLTRAGRLDEAEPLLRDSLGVLETRRAKDETEYARARERLAALLDARGQTDGARELRERP